MSHFSIVIADDHALYADALSLSLRNHVDPTFDILAIASNGAELVKLLESHSPDCILLDLNMPVMNGMEALPHVKKAVPDCKVIVVTMYDQPKFIKQVFKSHGDGYFLKTNPLNELVDAVEHVMEGETYLSRGLKIFPKELTANGDEMFDDDFQLIQRLTRRELEILQLISGAKSNKEIADELFISDQTVMVHRKNIMRKLSVSSTAGLIKFALDHDLS